MEKQDGRRIVTGTSGRYFTGLRTGTTAEVDDALAVDAVGNDLGAQRFGAGEEDESALSGSSHGLVVLPTGTGVLTRHITVRGKDPAGGEPVLREVYIDAQAGYPVLRYSGVQTFGTPRAAARASVAHRLADAPAPGTSPGSGVGLDGRTVELYVSHDDTRDAYVLRPQDVDRAIDLSGSK
ncbi:hypothetical protein Scel_22340 [Streptomyces cellostaticus]|nr:hypothetical protein Scel_22340 [Streptomyces cellostaticus]